MKRIITISYKPVGEAMHNYIPIPQIRLANRFLANYGFNVGDKIKVEYQAKKITITKYAQNPSRN